VGAGLALVRAIHIAALLLLVGLFAFRLGVEAPALRALDVAGAPLDGSVHEAARARTIWAALAAALASGALWLVLQASVMSGRSPSAVISSGVLATVVGSTRAGHVWIARSGLLSFLALALSLQRKRPSPGCSRSLLVFTLAAGAAATLVWTGHAGAASGAAGALQQASDALHLLAAGAWLGGLVALILLLGAALRAGDERWLALGRGAAGRFSALGLAGAATLLATGLLAGWLLVGDLAGLLGSAYGRWLLLKIGLFAAMLGVAAVNRWRLLPRLSGAGAREPIRRALARLRRNCILEAALGALVVIVVGELGTLAPAAHLGRSLPSAPSHLDRTDSEPHRPR